MRARRPADPAEVSPFDLLEEAVALLRRAPLSAWLVYYAGALPFSLALLAFVAEMSRAAFAAARVASLSLFVALLFALFCLTRADFCARLGRLVRESDPPKAGLSATAALQLAFHGWSLFLLPVVALTLVPLGWAVALAQNVTALGRTERRGALELLRRANAQALLWPRQNHAVLLVLGAFSLAVFANVALTLLVAPQLVKMLTGSENVFSRSGLYVLNSSFFAAALVLTGLAVDPLVKAVYTLRCFLGESLATGEDLIVSLRTLRERRAEAGLLLVLLALPASPFPLRAEAAPRQPARISAPALDRAIGEVLRDSRYTWRERRELPELPGPLSGFFAAIRRAASRAFHAVADAVASVWRFVRDLLTPGSGPRERGSGGIWGGFVGSRALLFGALALVAALGALLLLRSRRRAHAAPEAAAEPVLAPLPDPLLPSTTADLRDPEDWLVLGREWIEKGDLRRGLRALYLAALGTLARAEMIRLSPAKSNGEYARELERRAADRGELLAAFGALVTEFERSWYGRHEVTAEGLGRVKGELERVRAHAA